LICLSLEIRAFAGKAKACRDEMKELCDAAL
jgi:hypothetical protein